MKSSATTASSTAARRPAAINLDDLPALIERADDLVALITRNRAARAGLGRTGREVLRQHERALEAELAGIRELASHRMAATTVEALGQVIFALGDLREAQGRAAARGDREALAILDRAARLLDGAREGLDQLGEGKPVWRIAEHLAPLADGPHSRVALAMTQIAAAEAADA